MDQKKELIDKLRKLASELKKTPTRNEFTGSFVGGEHKLRIHFGGYNSLVKEAGLSTYDDRRSTETKTQIVAPEITPPVFPDDDIPVEEMIDSMCKRFSKRKTAHDSKKWMEFKVNTNKPIGIMWFGDPHIDDNGCNWPLLKEHIDICKNTDGMYGANIGDTHNNWVGRLAKEYANQDTSRGTAWKLINWFFLESGVKWLVMLLGNHDSWNFGAETMPLITKNICPMVDWRAQFKLIFSNGAECLVDAAHNHTGHSQWNALHGQQKASSIGGIAHVYIAGHLHNWALAQNECPNTGRIYWLARARGYKHIDHYAENLGFGSQKNGSSIVMVIDPKADEINRVRCFADPKEGAEYLTYLRGKK